MVLHVKMVISSPTLCIALALLTLNFKHVPADNFSDYSLNDDGALPAQLRELFRYIDKHKEEYISILGEAVGIQSVSASPAKRDETLRMVKWTAEKLEKMGASLNLLDIGNQTLPDGNQIKLPPVIMGSIGNDSSKKTVCIYGHLDVQPAAIEDGWETDPFVLARKGNELFGRGASDDKGPVLAFIHAIEALLNSEAGLPVNVKFIFESMEESGSKELDDLLNKNKYFFRNVDYVCISDNTWLGKTKPCVTYGVRGLSYFAMEVKCSSRDLHSGIYGGSVYEAMPDLIYMLNTLTDGNGSIAIPGIMDDVRPLSEEEEHLYQDIDFDVAAYQAYINATVLRHNGNKTKILMARARYPALSIHGIEGAFSDPGEKTVIPGKVRGKFSIRSVPDQTPEKISNLVIDFLNKKWEERGSPNIFRVDALSNGRPWLSDTSSPNYQAAIKATEHVYRMKPDLTREGGSIPVTLTLQEVSGKTVVHLPVGASDDGAHSQNEKINIRNYIEGTKLLGAYLYECSRV